MSVDSSFSNDLAYVPQQNPDPPAVLARLQLGSIRRLSPLPLTAAAIMIGGGVIAAISSGANIALAILVGYGALASTIALMLAAASATQPSAPKQIDIEPTAIANVTTAAAWKLVNTFSISDASRLFCSIEPGSAATQESMAWGRALLDAIKQGELPLAAKTGATQSVLDRERENPHYMTEVTREALRSWADQKGPVPAFLHD